MSGNRAQRRIKELRSQKPIAAQLYQLTEDEQQFLQLVAFNPGYKMNSGETQDRWNQSMWPFMEQVGCIECVGGYKWKATPRGLLVMRLLNRRIK